MKKFAIIAIALTVVAASSCKNRASNKQAEEQEATPEMSQKEQMIQAELQINLAAFVESTKKINNLPFERGQEGEFKLTEKDKKVKPDYLLDPNCVNDLVSLSQKYRAISMLMVDKVIAGLYELPVERYEQAISKLAVDINDPSFKSLTEMKSLPSGEMTSKLYEDECAAGRPNLFWESIAAGLVEQLYVCTKNIDRFTAMFDDETASDVTYNFVLLHEGIISLVDLYPEMESLNQALYPLYVINAITVDQFRQQLTELKGEIEIVRALLIK